MSWPQNAGNRITKDFNFTNFLGKIQSPSKILYPPQSSASTVTSFCNQDMLDLDKHAQDWHDQGAWNILWRFSIPVNKWWQLVMVTKHLSHSHFGYFFLTPSELNPILPGKSRPIPIPILPSTTLSNDYVDTVIFHKIFFLRTLNSQQKGLYFDNLSRSNQFWQNLIKPLLDLKLLV